jgi:hypothetical protein
MPHAAVLAIENEVNRAKDELERKERRRDKIVQECKDDKKELEKLRSTLRTVRRTFEPDSLRKPDSPEGAPAPAPTQNSGSDMPSEDSYKRFRDEYVYKHKEETFTGRMVAEELGTHPTTARKLLTMGVERGLLESIGKYRPPGFAGGQPPEGYRYITEVEERPVRIPGSEFTDPGTGGGPRKSGAPVAGTGDNPRNGIHKDFYAVTAKARAQGARLRQLGNGHVRLQKDGKNPVTCSATPGDHRALTKFKNDMRRAGYPL